MTLLALDIGNTRLKWATFEDGVIRDRGAMFMVEVAHFVAREGFATQRPQRVIGSNVASLTYRERIERQFTEIDVPIHWITSTERVCGVTNGYDEPSRLGTDRWAALVAAHARKLGPCVVVSAGTALTVDQMDEAGNFLGGAIVAGYHAMLGGLAGNTAALSVDAGGWTAQPKNTRDALATGAIDAMVGAIEAGHERLQVSLRDRNIKATPKVVLTGGSAFRLLDHLHCEATVIETLALEGVYLIGTAA
jgi:type III pantothenate kinase